MPNITQTFKVTAKSFIMTIGNNIGRLPTRCDFTSFPKLILLARFTDSIMSENPLSDNKNGQYRLYTSINFTVMHDGNRIIAVSPMALYPGVVDTHVGRELAFTPPDITVDFLTLNRRSESEFFFGWRAQGRPALAAEPPFQLVCPRISRYIWHRIFGGIRLVNGMASINASVSGSEFPSHRAYVNGRITGFVRQGPFSNLWISAAGESSRVNETSIMAEILNENI